MNATERIPLLMRVPPPLLFVLTFLAGVGVQHLMGFTIATTSAVRVGGMMVVCCGAFLALYSVGTFFAARTTVIPFSDASRMVTWGPYRFTRNPMYVALVVVYLGVAAMTSQVVPLVLLPIPILVLQRVVIPFEEGRMRKVFGQTYEQYCSNVRRWV